MANNVGEATVEPCLPKKDTYVLQLPLSSQSIGNLPDIPYLWPKLASESCWGGAPVGFLAWVPANQPHFFFHYRNPPNLLLVGQRL